MSNGLFFCSVDITESNEQFIKRVESYSDSNAKQVYIINSPLLIPEQSYMDSEFFVLMIPKYKLCFINPNEIESDSFEVYIDDFTEDIGYLAEKYDYKKKIGRPRHWKKELITFKKLSEINSIEKLATELEIEDLDDQRVTELIISLATGSINNIDIVGGDTPRSILDQVKKKIVLFDGDQSRFLFPKWNFQNENNEISIQGLAGTGKTELLLHKLMNLYTRDKNSRIVFTCYNKILAKSLKKRVPEFFNFMHVEEQIKWEERLWVMPSWGSSGMINTGIYSYICSFYNLPFRGYSLLTPFDVVCKEALEKLKKRDRLECCFDYVLIDESQDFPNSFIELCKYVTSKTVYIAGDIFQDIYDRNVSNKVKPDFLLNKCYRTDPRTLMFAHALGMGLYEKPVIRWLNDEEWELCGYEYKRIEQNKQFILSRKPLRRFEDIDIDTYSSIEIIDYDSTSSLTEKVIDIINTIKSNHPTVLPGDIAVVFLESNDSENYDFANKLTQVIYEQFGWNTTKGYETKDSYSNAVFISNKNNIKGLEFPFVICTIKDKIGDDIFLRNTIYMMLTRSFITSYLVINNENSNKEIVKKYEAAAKFINQNGYMILDEPSSREKEAQNSKLQIMVKRSGTNINELLNSEFEAHPYLNAKSKDKIKKEIAGIFSENPNLSSEELIVKARKLIEVYE